MTNHLNSNLLYNAVNYGDLTNKTLEENKGSDLRNRDKLIDKNLFTI